MVHSRKAMKPNIRKTCILYLFLTARPKFPTLPELPVQASTCQSQPALPGI